jgi:hypothetical protein
MLTDRSLAARRTILSRNLEKTVGIDLERGNELGLATRHWWDTSELELAEKTVVAALSPLSFVTGNYDVNLMGKYRKNELTQGM